MDILKIASQADVIIRKICSSDPFKIAEELGITIVWAKLGNVKGCFKVIKKNAFIFLNENLTEEEAKTVLGHEIGHFKKHYKMGMKKYGLAEFSLYDMTAKPEVEANYFGAELLLSDKSVLDYIRYNNYSVDQIAAAEGVLPAFVALKIDILRERGYKLRAQEYDHNFLRR